MIITTNKIATLRELKEFGLLFGTFFALIFGILIPWISGGSFPIWPWLVFIIAGGLALIYPKGLRLLFIFWTLFGGIMSWLNTRIILGFVFYCVITPVGLLVRLSGNDLLATRIDPKRSTYRIFNKENQKTNLENPF